MNCNFIIWQCNEKYKNLLRKRKINEGQNICKNYKCMYIWFEYKHEDMAEVTGYIYIYKLHTHIYTWVLVSVVYSIYIYIYMCVCVCVTVYVCEGMKIVTSISDQSILFIYIYIAVLSKIKRLMESFINFASNDVWPAYIFINCTSMIMIGCYSFVCSFIHFFAPK